LNVDDVMMFEVLPAIVHDSMWSYERAHGITRIVDEARLVRGETALKAG
jgi:hypothetical protein